jgi:IS1 family transposase
MQPLTIEKRAQILNCLVEGCSMRSTSRLTGAAKKTVERLLVAAGKACADYHDKIMRNLNCRLIQVDEIWAFCGCKEAHVPELLRGSGEIGDVWLWTALDADTKLIPAYYVGNRGKGAANWFVADLASRVNNRIQLTSDGHAAYPDAVERAFGYEIDYAMLIKQYEAKPSGKYSPPVCIGVHKLTRCGQPDRDLISTSFVERSNLTWRMSNRRLTRLTNAFSKKLENHKHAIALSMMHYNFCRIHQTLRVTPAMEAGITDHVWSLEELAALIVEPVCLKV